MVFQTELEVGVEALHVLVELGAAGVGESTHSQHGLLVHSAAVAGEHRQQRLHDGVSKCCDARLGHILLAQLLDDYLEHAAQQPLHSACTLSTLLAHVDSVSMSLAQSSMQQLP